MSGRKKIALLLGQPEESYQNEYVQGFFKQAFEYGYDVCVFAMYKKYQESEPREIGDSNIFQLVHYQTFDAVVLLMDTIRTPGAAYAIEKEIKKIYKGPVLCVDKKISGFSYAEIEHYMPIVKMISHLIEEHNFTDIAFLTGNKWHPHSTQRLQGFLDCMEAHGLTVGENRVFYGDFWYNSGSNVVEELLKDREHLPQAIACANDYMAIGAADQLTRYGIRVPEDIAVVGYDSVNEGRTSPSPITSIPLPAKQFGSYGAECVKALMEGKEVPRFEPDIELFIGYSCGCQSEIIVPELPVRKSWGTDISEGTFYSSFNHLMEDMLSCNTFEGLMDMIQTYTYQIREFDSFYLCLNDSWIATDKEKHTHIIKKGYTGKIVPVLKCGPSGKGENQLNFTDTFDVTEMLPALHEEHDVPKGYIFTPLHFEGICFGYAVISYGNEPKCIDDTYYMWLRNVMMGMECYRRIEELRYSNEFVEESLIKDNLTGIFNYKGLVKHAKPLIERAKNGRRAIGVLAVDIVGMEKINSKCGREVGDRTIVALSKMLKEAAGEGSLCCRLGNDEFIIAQISKEANNIMIQNVLKRLQDMLEEYNKHSNDVEKIEIATGFETGRVSDFPGIEQLINTAVGRKNGNKTKNLQIKLGKRLSDEEVKEAKTVAKILDENLFTYHFQPIVNAEDGSIFAYEALMRTKVTPMVSPLQVIKYATHLGRLYEVERATFFNVLQCIEDHTELFEGKKVFINSIPDIQLTDEDAQLVAVKMQKFGTSVVVELTEQTEADDTALAKMKETFCRMGVEIAVDDYGAGYSNIVNLLRYMPNYVKIDRMLLSGIQDNPQKQHFVKDIIHFARENDFKVLAEGVETTEELQTVIALGTDMIQGYYTAKPNAEIVQAIAPEIVKEIQQYYKMSKLVD